MDKPKILKHPSLCLVFSVLIIALLSDSIQSVLNKDYSERIPFTDVRLSYVAHPDLPIERHVFRDQTDSENFLFAPNSPSELQIRLTALRSANTIINIEPLYSTNNCSTETIGKTRITIYSHSLVDESFAMADGVSYQVPFEFFKGDRLQIDVSESGEARCGKAQVSFSTSNNTKNYVYGFIIFWSGLAVIFYFLGLSPMYIALGGVFNSGLILANTTLSAAVLGSLIITTVISLGLVGLLMMVFGLPIWRSLRMLIGGTLYIVMLSVPLLFISYQHTFTSPADINAVHAVLQSNLRQGVEYLLAFWQWQYSVYLLLLIGFIFVVLYLISSIRYKKVTTFFVGLLLTIISAVQWPLSLDRMPMMLIVKEGLSIYFHEFELFRKIRDERHATLNQIGASTDAQDQTLVVILGESASKHHMSSYGYVRKTTPFTDELIDNGQMIRFDAAYSNHTLSNQTISRALTGASNYNDGNWIRTPSAINLAHTAGIETAWVSNKPMYGAFDSHMSVIGTEANHVTYINTRIGIRRVPNQHDGEMLPLVKEAIANQEGNQVVFMHLQGSHTLYCQRTPEEFKTFIEKPKKYIYGRVVDVFFERYRSINCYDDSIRYTDQIIANMVNHLDSDSEPAAMLYFSDHGESAIHNKAHNPAVFDYQMSDIPMFFWANEEWKKQNAQKWTTLESNRQKVFTNDHAYELISGLNGISSGALDERNNLASSDYQEDQEPTTLHGSMRLDASSNGGYWQQKNIVNFAERDQLHKIVAQRSNSVNKVSILQSAGVDSVEIDVHFKAGRFMVGLNASSMADVDLETFLGALSESEIGQIWLNIVSIDKAEIASALDRLEYLDQMLKLKDKITLLVFSDYASKFLDSGFMVFENISDLTNLGENLVQRIENSPTIGFALNEDQYKVLSSQIDEDVAVDLHLVVSDRITLSHPNMLDLIDQSDYLNDERVSSISLQAWSIYEL